MITFVSDSVLVSTIPFQLLLQDLKHLFVFNLIEALVELPDRREIWRRAQTDHLVYVFGELGYGILRANRYSRDKLLRLQIVDL